MIVVWVLLWSVCAVALICGLFLMLPCHCVSHVAAAARFVDCKCLALSFAFVVHCVGVVLCVLVDNASM